MRRCCALVFVVLSIAFAQGAEDPPAFCPVCRGTQLMPILPYKPYVKFEGGTAPDPDYPAQWKYCDKCKAGIDAKAAAEEISADIKETQERARRRTKAIEGLLGGDKKVEVLYTPFVTVRSMLPAAANRQTGEALEKCAGIVMKTFNSMVLTCTRPDRHGMLFVSDKLTFSGVIDRAFGKMDKEQRDLFRKGSGFSMSNGETDDAVQNFDGASNGAPNRAVWSWGKQMMHCATNGKAKAWLVEGFGAWCENTTLQANTMHSFEYEANTTLHLSQNWNEDIRRQSAKFVPWPEMFNQTLVHLKAHQYLQFYAMVSFMIKVSPERFDKFVIAIRNGEEAGPAIERIYGRKLPDIIPVWNEWMSKLR